MLKVESPATLQTPGADRHSCKETTMREQQTNAVDAKHLDEIRTAAKQLKALQDRLERLERGLKAKINKDTTKTAKTPELQSTPGDCLSA